MHILEKLKTGQRVRIAFLGDSVTEGCFEGDARPEDQQYVYHTRFCNMLRERYPNAQIESTNAGIGGNTAGMGLFRMETDVLARKPDFCVVCFGINDTTCCALNRFTSRLRVAKSLLATMAPHTDAAAFALLQKHRPKEAYRYAMEQILKKLAENRIPAMVLTPNRMSLSPIADKRDPAYFLSVVNANLTRNGTMDSMMDIARAVAGAYHVPVADGYAHWKALEDQGRVTPGTYANGTNHPSRALHQELAHVLFAAFERM